QCGGLADGGRDPVRRVRAQLHDADVRARAARSDLRRRLRARLCAVERVRVLVRGLAVRRRRAGLGCDRPSSLRGVAPGHELSRCPRGRPGGSMDDWEVAARVAIDDTTARYVRFADGGRAVELASLFTEDGVLVTDTDEVRGRAAIARYLDD